jgi:hypothetical protein
MAQRLMDPVVTRALVVIQAVTETIADLENRPDASDWSEQIETLKAMRHDLMNEIGLTPAADYMGLLAGRDELGQRPEG